VVKRGVSERRLKVKNWFRVFIVSAVIGMSVVSCTTSVLKYSTLYLDLDGTAVDADGQVRQATIQAVKDFKAHGGQVGIATGRALTQAQDIIRQIQPTLPVVLFNGSAIWDVERQKLLTFSHIDEETLKRFRIVAENDARIRGSVFHFPVASVPDRDSLAFSAVAQEMQLAPAYHVRLTQLSADSLLKILVVARNTDLDSLSQKFQQALSNATVVTSTPTTLEIVPKSITKFQTISHILKERGISPNRLVAIGDGMNDLEMVRGAGLGVAMSNGAPRVREAADLIIGANSTDAIGKFIQFLIK
jgi:Cof subfamily protein (haloacid dehalogenase superfamily)